MQQIISNPFLQENKITFNPEKNFQAQFLRRKMLLSIGERKF